MKGVGESWDRVWLETEATGTGNDRMTKWCKTEVVKSLLNFFVKADIYSSTCRARSVLQVQCVSPDAACLAAVECEDVY